MAGGYSGWNRRYPVQQRHRSADRPRRQAGPASVPFL